MQGEVLQLLDIWRLRLHNEEFADNRRKERTWYLIQYRQEFAMKASGLLPNMERNDEERVEGEPVDYSKVDPSRYKDIFESPTTFEEAWVSK